MVLAIDGTTLLVQDTEDNRSAFGLPGSAQGQAGYPQIRVVAITSTNTHILAGAAIGPCRGKGTGELSLARELWKQVPNHSVTIMDKIFQHHAQLHTLHSTGTERHWLLRAKKTSQWNVIRELGHGDVLVEMKINAKDRKENPELPRTFICRAICYRVDGAAEHHWLLTSLTDHDRYPAESVVKVYHARWEIEVGYDEIKTHMLDREETIRSRTAEKTRQELWGILLAYNLIRMKMMDVSTKCGYPPTRLSFTHTLRLVRVFCEIHAWVAAPTKLPARIEALEDMLALLILPERRSERAYPRHTKIRMSSYKKNPGRIEVAAIPATQGEKP